MAAPNMGAYATAGAVRTTRTVGTGGNWPDWASVPWSYGENYDGQDLAFTEQVTVGGSGIYVQDASVANGSGYGVNVTDYSDIRIENVTVTAADEAAILVYQNAGTCDSVVIDGCNVSGVTGTTQFGTGYRVVAATNVTIQNCVGNDLASEGITAQTSGCKAFANFFEDFATSDTNADGIQFQTSADNCWAKWNRITFPAEPASTKACILNGVTGSSGGGVEDNHCVGGDDNIVSWSPDGGVIKRNLLTDNTPGTGAGDGAKSLPEGDIEVISNVSDTCIVTIRVRGGQIGCTATVAQNTCNAFTTRGLDSNGGQAMTAGYYNNIFVSGRNSVTTDRYAAVAAAVTETFDANCYSGSGPQWAVNGTAYSTLGDWQSNVGGGDTGALHTDPLMIDPDNDDFRLRPASPCARAGTTWWSEGTPDYEGQRFYEEATIGAYEFRGRGTSGVFEDRVRPGDVDVPKVKEA